MRGLRSGEWGRQCPRPKAKRRRRKELWLSFGVLSSALWLNMAAVAPTRAADYVEESTPDAKGLLSGMFGEKPKTQAKRDNKAVEVKPRPTTTVVSAEAERQRHQNALIRRLAVCDRLKTIADQTGNEALMNQAYELEERATLLYRQQTSGLATPMQTPLSVLADDRQNPSRERTGPAANAPQSFFGGRGPSASRQPTGTLAPRLNGNMDQREQAILNGTNMGGNGP